MSLGDEEEEEKEGEGEKRELSSTKSAGRIEQSEEKGKRKVVALGALATPDMRRYPTPSPHSPSRLTTIAKAFPVVSDRLPHSVPCLLSLFCMVEG